MSNTEITEVCFEHRADALGMGTARPHIPWIVETNYNGWRQTAYEIQVQRNDASLRDSTGRVESDQSVLVP